MQGAIDRGEREELELLRVENDVLRRKLESLEELLAGVEQKVGQRQSQHSESSEMVKLDRMLSKLEESKRELLENDEAKCQLTETVAYLYSLLLKAKEERDHWAKLLAESREETRIMEAKMQELKAMNESDSKAFKAMVRRDRREYEKRLAKIESRHHSTGLTLDADL